MKPSANDPILLAIADAVAEFSGADAAVQRMCQQELVRKLWQLVIDTQQVAVCNACERCDLRPAGVPVGDG